MSCLRIALAGILWLGANTALANEGIVQINQASVTAAGGFPFVISSSGSYRLTSNLNVASTTADGISVTTDDVTLDLNGFTLRGPGSGTGDGIAAASSQRVIVRNGTVADFGGDGLHAGRMSLVHGVRTQANGGLGIDVDFYSRVSHSIAESNGSDGIFARAGSIVSESTARLNGGSGISTARGSLVRDSHASNNMTDGFTLATDSLLNRSSSLQNTGQGLTAGAGCLIRAGTFFLNTGNAIGAGSSTGLSNNNISGALGGGIELGQNVCNDTLTCP